MPSPFPGMNPYLEQNDTWEDFHTTFITYMQEALSEQVGPNYLVKIEVRLILHELSAEERLEMPAVEVERQRSRPREATAMTTWRNAGKCWRE
jgi:hypothetical protein